MASRCRSLPILARSVYRRERLRFFQKTRDADKGGKAEGREARSERAGERESEEERHQRTERNLKGHPAIHLSMQPLTRRLFVRRDRTNPSGKRDFLLSSPLSIRSPPTRVVRRKYNNNNIVILFKKES